MRKLNVTILVGVLVALLGFGLVLAYGNNVDQRVADGKKTRPVLVASSTLAAGSTPGDLSNSVGAKDVPEAYIADGALTDLKDVQGQVLLGPVGSGSQLTASMFGQPLEAGAVKPSKGNLALAVGVELSPGVARYLVPGATVDVFATYQTATASGAATASSGAAAQRTKLFVSGVKVMSVSIGTPPAGTGSDGTTSTSGNTEVVAVLDLSPEDAEKVVNATTLGTLYFGLSSVDGSGQTHRTPRGVTPDDVVVSNR